MLAPMTPRPDPLESLALRLDLAGTVDEVRAACVELRSHPALRRHAEEAAAEAGIRAARANAALAGARLPVDAVREAVLGLALYPSDAAGDTVRGAVRVNAEVERLGSLWQRAPLQALARLHVAAGAGLIPDDALGRPRLPGEDPLDGHDLFAEDGSPVPAPAGGSEVAERLKALRKLLAKPGGRTAPVLLVAAAAHAELMITRPFLAGNALVARGICRSILRYAGFDPTGVVVWEAGLLAMGVRYPLSLARYADDEDGAADWLRTFAAAMLDGVAEGRNVCDAVAQGRLTSR